MNVWLILSRFDSNQRSIMHTGVIYDNKYNRHNMTVSHGGMGNGEWEMEETTITSHLNTDR